MIFPPPLIVLRFSWGGWEGGAFYKALAFLLALTDKNDNNKAPLSLSGKSGFTSGLKSSFFENLLAVNH